MAACVALDPAAPIVPTLAGYLDCAASALGRGGFASGAGAILPSGFLAACLTIFVALIGYRLAAGLRFDLRDATLAAVRVGLVIAFSAGWQGYEALFHDVVVEGPTEIAGALLAPLGLAVPTVGDTAQALQQTYEAIQTRNAQLRDAGAAAAQSPPSGTTPPAASPVPPAAPSPTPPASQVAASGAQATPTDLPGVLLMVSALGGLLALHLAAGLLLAVGPLLISLALFDATLGLFEGWLRALFAVSLGGAALTVVAALEVVFLREVVVPRADPATGFSGEPGLLVAAALFAVVTLGTLAAMVMIGRGLRLPRPRLRSWPHPIETWRPALAPALAAGEPQASLAARSRARAVADAVLRQGEREGASASEGVAFAGSRSAVAAPVGFAGAPGESWVSLQGLRRAPRRAARPSRTAAAARRDERR